MRLRDSQTQHADGVLIGMAILLALRESPTLGENVDGLERRVVELVALGEREIRPLVKPVQLRRGVHARHVRRKRFELVTPEEL